MATFKQARELKFYKNFKLSMSCNKDLTEYVLINILGQSFCADLIAMIYCSNTSMCSAPSGLNFFS